LLQVVDIMFVDYSNSSLPYGVMLIYGSLSLGLGTTKIGLELQSSVIYGPW